jgi:methyl-accepting chemotaxis protein
VAEIAGASAEQASGIEQVNKALTQMDEVTQQNSALVEENAASAKTLEQQSATMNDRVAFFQIDEEGQAEPVRTRAAAANQPVAVASKTAAPKRVAAAASTRGPARQMQSALATALKVEPDWKEF